MKKQFSADLHSFWRFLFSFTENQIEEEETVLDFSSGSAQEVENTATEVKQTETIETTNGFEILTKGYEKLGLEEELAGIGNITIFAPRDDDFKKAGIDIDRIGNYDFSAVCLHFIYELQLFVYIFIMNFSYLFTFQFSAICLHFSFVYFGYLFTFQLWISALCLHFKYDFRRFVYISILNFSYLFTFKFSAICLHFSFVNFGYLFTFRLWMSAVCLHFNCEFQQFVYISNIIFGCLFTFQFWTSTICLHFIHEFRRFVYILIKNYLFTFYRWSGIEGIDFETFGPRNFGTKRFERTSPDLGWSSHHVDKRWQREINHHFQWQNDKIEDYQCADEMGHCSCHWQCFSIKPRKFVIVWFLPKIRENKNNSCLITKEKSSN